MRVANLFRKMSLRFRPRQDHWTHFLSVLDKSTLEYDPDLDEATRREIFRRTVTLVELEPHAYCNRTCSFCPNSTIDRLTVKSTLDRSVYERILSDLRSIEYDQVLRFARYSEPMAHDHIYEMVTLARQYLPTATIDIVTNGDYLFPEALARLRAAGLSVLRVSVYMRRGVPWSVVAARGEIERLGQRIGISPKWNVATATSVGAVFPCSSMEIVTFSHNFDEVGYDRGQMVEGLIDLGYVRRSPCFLVFSNFTVDFNGKVMPCCNLRSDHPQHERFILGDLTGRQESIFDIYASRQFTEWRRALVAVDEKKYPCATCKQKALDGAALERMRGAIESKLSEIGVEI